MINVGIFTGYYPYTLSGTIDKIKQAGMGCVQLDLEFTDIDLRRGRITKEKAHQVRNAFRRANIPIVAISAYTNLVHPDPVKRAENIAAVKEILAHARHFGTPYVISETGTYNTDSDWLYDPKNSTEEAYQEFKAIAKELATFAYEHNAVFLVENYVNNIIGSVGQVARLMQEVEHPGLGLALDPTNYFDDKNIDAIDETLHNIFNVLESRIKIAHAKDCKKTDAIAEKFGGGAAEHNSFRGAGSVELPAAGLGALNYPLYVELLAQKHPNIPLIIEHVDEEDIPRAKRFVDEVLMATGS
ncbi:sugar phosphate isomerase/epimerase [Yersinia pestis]|uniref:AP endonuclease n=15 Tax=Yersinia pseudotuberculosis complex TaxID=1649845 RepID=A0AAX2HX47_YERPE|nr:MULTISPECIES: sugar phosphate isomerase/epimerase [Yersinia pseudotuberculosis complex]EDR33209.1 AP endonuclease, family 2 [Yersinia pestis biovar Orientalis str. IP275]EFA47940.1 AP endonuclease, family 2 [Yersinia pestis KIM D27]ERP79585.1 xylose isomerase [Yersinia pestis 24H]ERP79819.1 xylose isomerase [Yersinia pestis S3]ERP84718.1 xylose isomerase [Yersinia pestis 9]CQD58205.1 AP endonuclease [Yersinia intermedia]